MSRILVVDDDGHIREVVRFALQQGGFQVVEARDGAEAWAAFEAGGVDLVVLDIIMPEADGLEICRRIRARSRVPILFLSSRDEELDRVLGLELGADDYLPKRFAVRELLARVRALLRRAAKEPPLEELTIGRVRFDFRALAASGGRAASLTTHDILVMRVLAARRGELVRRIDIVEEVCGLDSEATLRTVDNHVMALRRALGDDPRRPRFLHTVRGEGYRLTLE
jgi:DNA-binding response OmpR family regulator